MPLEFGGTENQEKEKEHTYLLVELNIMSMKLCYLLDAFGSKNQEIVVFLRQLIQEGHPLVKF